MLRPVESHSRAQGNILARALKTCLPGPSGEKFLEFFFSKWCKRWTQVVA